MWRSEDETAVQELVCRPDYTFTTWTSYVEMLTTPSIFIDTGKWLVRGDKLVLEIDDAHPEKKHIELLIVHIGKDALDMKNFDGTKTDHFKRLYLDDHAFAATARGATESDIVGTWQVHYNTHDYEMSFEKDHSVVTSGRIGVDGQLEHILTGAWRIDGKKLILESKTTEGGSTERAWTITGIEPHRLGIRDGPIPYVLIRLK